MERLKDVFTLPWIPFAIVLGISTAIYIACKDGIFALASFREKLETEEFKTWKARYLSPVRYALSTVFWIYLIQAILNT